MAIRRFSRGLWSYQKNYGVLSGKVVSIPSGSGGTVSVANGYTNHTFTSVGVSTFIVNSAGLYEIHMWGAGGAAGGTGGGSYCYGGSGAYASSTITLSPGIYSVIAGGGGQLGTQGCVTGSGGAGGTGGSGIYAGGAGSAAGTSPCSGTGGGGGAASAFLDPSSIALVVAGGGGGGGGTESAENNTGRGGGGGQNGQNGAGSNATGGTAGASGSTNGGNAPLKGGDHSGSGGGGGGVVGGSGGINPDNDAVSGGGGGGGTSLGTTVLNGNYGTPGNNGSPLYISGKAVGGGSGSSGADGFVIIRYMAAGFFSYD